MSRTIVLGATAFYFVCVFGLATMGLAFTEHNVHFSIPILMIGLVGFARSRAWFRRLATEQGAADSLPELASRENGPRPAVSQEIRHHAEGLNGSRLKHEILFSLRLLELGVRLNLNYVDQAIGRWSSHFPIETRLFASLAVLAGLLGTFVGLAGSVAEYQSIVDGEAGEFMKSVKAILGGLDQAFGSTALGAVTAMALEAINRTQERESLRLQKKIEKYFLETVLSAASRITDSRLARQFQDILIQETSEQTRRVAEALAETTSRMADSSARFTSAVVGISETLDTIGTIGPTLDRSMGLVARAQDGVANLVDAMQKATGDLRVAVGEVRSAVAESSSASKDSIGILSTGLATIDQHQHVLTEHVASVKLAVTDFAGQSVEGQKRLGRSVRGVDESIRLVHEAVVAANKADANEVIVAGLDGIEQNLSRTLERLGTQIGDGVQSQESVTREMLSGLRKLGEEVARQPKSLGDAAVLLVQASEQISKALGQGTPANTLEHLGLLAQSSSLFARQAQSLSAEVALLSRHLRRRPWWQFWRRHEQLKEE